MPVEGPGADRGMVFQSYTLFPWLTIEQNIRLACAGVACRRPHQKERAAYFIAKVGLRGFEQHFPKQLSGGMQQRTAIARAAGQRPQDFADGRALRRAGQPDPRAHARAAAGIWEAERKTVLFVTHDIDEAIFMANRVAVFSAGPAASRPSWRWNCRTRAITRSRPALSSWTLQARLTEEIRAESMAADLH